MITITARPKKDQNLFKCRRKAKKLLQIGIKTKKTNKIEFSKRLYETRAKTTKLRKNLAKIAKLCHIEEITEKCRKIE